MVSYNDKITLINYFRSVAERELCSIVRSTHDYRKQASKIKWYSLSDASTSTR